MFLEDGLHSDDKGLPVAAGRGPLVFNATLQCVPFHVSPPQRVPGDVSRPLRTTGDSYLKSSAGRSPELGIGCQACLVRLYNGPPESRVSRKRILGSALLGRGPYRSTTDLRQRPRQPVSFLPTLVTGGKASKQWHSTQHSSK
ncbi:hypothetical protein CABS01_04459 [Colletotrichum abscissum]|uniref:Uncharacterized protein n=1 Tax=Colletotrichum abscissum TaxID=1671311 RepID=A0A9Q0B7T0_9PEZI|nr:uncharacterized protein CABS01_04459 [Colletotrichum abscissum]KAI3556323.1 hypothetical protein CABS02_03606 [Colletotrichum abscissum]KAK1473797.1 hypothetical protein CABS01_04459 [Colletotrichum abscissum]